MGLETFNFIPDLVATNPEPTDPVAQGDDHLRGIKFTLQTQWPNIGDNAVTRTALQMNDAALRSEANAFTGANSFSGLTDFSASARLANAVFLQAEDAAAANFRNLIGVTAADEAQIGNPNYTTTIRSLTGIRSENDGVNATPAFGFISESGMGMFRQSAGTLSLAVNAARIIDLKADALITNQQIQAANGSVSSPGVSFQGDTGMGMFRGGAGLLNFAVQGAELFSITAAGIIHNAVGSFQSGSSALPGITFNTTRSLGISAAATTIMAFNSDGVERARIGNTQWETSVPTTTQNEGTCHRNVDTQARTGWRFTNAANNPMWSIYLGTSPSNVLSFQRYNSSGAFQDIPFQLDQTRGTVRMPTLPTSSAGLVAGDCWRNPVSPGFVAII